MSRAGRIVVMVLAWTLGLVMVAGGASAQGDEPDDDLLELAERFAPRIVVREQSQECGPGEPFQPTAVSDVLGRDDVTLTQDDQTSQAPSSLDLAGLGGETYLDYPGDPLNPECDYDRWSKEISAETPPTLYAHLATDPAHPGQLAMQYWFWWIYNDWNNRHEGDWEMIQVVFSARTPAEALAAGPASVAFAQHEGSETSPWNSPKLLKDGTHPVVYPSEGSHAAYYNQAQWFGKSAEAGFGCDNTAVDPSVHGVLWEPEIILVPSDPSPQDPDFAWLTYDGRWGEQAPSFNNGPTGPNTKRQWTEPIAWQLEEGRDGAAAIPPLPGPAVTTFCGLTAAGSVLFIEVLDRPVLTLGLSAVVIAVIVALVRATTWRGADVTHYDRERTSGQILGAAFVIYARRWPVFVGLGALFLAATWAVGLLRAAILDSGQGLDFTDTTGSTELIPTVLARLVALLLQGPIIVVFVTACIAVVSRPHREMGVLKALRRAVQPPVAALVIAGSSLVVAAMAVSVVLLPLGMWLFARWASAGAAAMVEGHGFAASLHRSAELTDRRRLRTLALTLLLIAVALATGPALGALLLLLTDWPFGLINAVVVGSFAVLLPILGIALTLQFYDLRHEQAREGRGAGRQPAATR